jgi:nucleotide-binding universal stress UspA family protein
MITKVMVPLDGSALAERALPCARQLAGAVHAEVHLVRVTEPAWANTWGPAPMYVPAGLYDELTQTEERVAAAYLKVAAEPAEQAGLRVRIEHLMGSPASTLLEYEREAGIDLVAMCSHGRSGLSRFALGSVAEYLLRHGKAPVLLVRAFGEPVRLDEVVLPLDGSARGDAELAMVRSLLPVGMREVTLLQVVESADKGLEAERYLAEIVHRQPGQGVGATWRSRVVQGDPATAILEAARPNKLVVMASHVRPAVTRWALGSVADRVARGGAAGVLVLRAG